MKQAFVVNYDKAFGSASIDMTDGFKKMDVLLRADVLLDAIHDLTEVYNSTLKKEGIPMPGNRKHTPYTSKSQTTAGNIALAAREGKIPKSNLKGASKEMAKGMTMKELVSHSAEAKGKDLPYKKSSTQHKGHDRTQKKGKY